MDPTTPSAVVWDWRKSAAAPGADRAGETAAARRRGAIGGLVGLSVAAVIWFLFDRPVAAAVIAGIAVVLTLIAFLAPLTLYKKISRGLEIFAYWVGSGVTWVLMTLLYYLLFLPVGLVLRARHKLGITRSADRKAPTYWMDTEARPRTPESYRRQF
ncbi:MAG TPA: hypothetical protein VE685_19265 [Thermoanaerobaculia bacterium]|nr:hypothetical protein [Thermoanaerobaculia bacterium]